MRKSLLTLTLFAITAVPAAFSQTPAPLPCDGAVTRVRVSTIKPGMMPQFEKAVAANLAWYRGKGITTNNIVLAKVIDRDAATKSYKFSESEAMTYHFNPPQATSSSPEPDDAYKAFVQMYNDSSTIKAEYTVCMPKSAM